jgi:predicted metal-dependent hydrolase
MLIDQLAFQFELPEAEGPLPVTSLQLLGEPFPVFFRRNERARNYLLYLRADGSINLTLPRKGSIRQGHLFLQSKHRWLERQAAKRRALILPPREWSLGTEVMLRGLPRRISVKNDGSPVLLSLGDLDFPVPSWQGNLRPFVEGHLQVLAKKELPARAWELAKQHQSKLKKITVRNQSSRWGSCSARGTVSLNWRLIQTPPYVSDYVILHELMHLREMNHSKRFWNLVSEVCPNYNECEEWLKLHAARLGL